MFYIGLLQWGVNFCLAFLFRLALRDLETESAVCDSTAVPDFDSIMLSSSKVDMMQDIVTGNPAVIKMVVHFNRCVIQHFTADNTKSNIGEVYKITNGVKWLSGTAQQLANEWSHFRVLSIESKLRKLCITHGFTLGVKGLNVFSS